MASRLVLGLKRKTPGSGGLGPVGEEGSWGPLPGLPGDENSLAQPPGLAPYCHCGIQLEPGGLCLEPASLALGWNQAS